MKICKHTFCDRREKEQWHWQL